MLKLETLQYIAFPYAAFTPLDVDSSFKWGVGTASSYKFKLFGFIPMGTHTIRIERFDEKTIRNIPTELQSRPVGKLFSCGSGQMRFTPTGSANGKSC